MDFLYFLLIGGLAGWLAGIITKGGGFGLIKNIIIGIVGAFLGGWTFGLLNIKAYGFVGSLLTATVGAIILLWILGKVRKK
jgi:uncharacterized membrane protein YeaQ/YmgE (transglycosylase-associated protein family)